MCIKINADIRQSRIVSMTVSAPPFVIIISIMRRSCCNNCSSSQNIDNLPGIEGKRSVTTIAVVVITTTTIIIRITIIIIIIIIMSSPAAIPTAWEATATTAATTVTIIRTAHQRIPPGQWADQSHAPCSPGQRKWPGRHTDWFPHR